MHQTSCWQRFGALTLLSCGIGPWASHVISLSLSFHLEQEGDYTFCKISLKKFQHSITSSFLYGGLDLPTGIHVCSMFHPCFLLP